MFHIIQSAELQNYILRSLDVNLARNRCIIDNLNVKMLVLDVFMAVTSINSVFLAEVFTF